MSVDALVTVLALAFLPVLADWLCNSDKSRTRVEIPACSAKHARGTSLEILAHRLRRHSLASVSLASVSLLNKRC